MATPKWKEGDIVTSIAFPHKVPRKIIRVTKNYLNRKGNIGYWFVWIHDERDAETDFCGMPHCISENALRQWVNGR